MTNLELIGDALRALGILDESETPSAEQGLIGLRKLNQVMATWAETDLTFPSWFPQTDLSAAAPIPDWAELAVTSALAIVMATVYPADVSEELVSIAEASREIVLRKRLNQQLLPVEAMTSQGTGNKSYSDFYGL
jgi:hypothetical protein